MRGEEEKKRVGNCCHVKGEGGGGGGGGVDAVPGLCIS